MIVLLPNKAGPKGACERFTASSMVRNTLVQIKTRVSRDDQVDYVHYTALTHSLHWPCCKQPNIRYGNIK